ncbi:MAG: 30S ribosomal protein S6, partial [Chloroflexi bacterium]|nr:30S ribosomal protein S6 [Chloroflexota bacterium]
MRLYELVVIFHPEIDPETLATLSGRIVSTITDHNGEIVARQTWGRQRL